MKIYAGILAGGMGTRMGLQEVPKQFLELSNRPILIHTIEKFLMAPEIYSVVVGVHPDWITYAEELISKFLPSYQNNVYVVEGGGDRNQTIKNIICFIETEIGLSDLDVIVTHDSVRPFVSLKTIQENLSLIQKFDAVDTVVEATDTIVQSLDSTVISDIPERRYLYQGQTPQTFRMKEFLNLYSNLQEEQRKKLTDACKIFVLNGKEVAIAQGDYSNIKITTVTDLKIACSMIEED